MMLLSFVGNHVTWREKEKSFYCEVNSFFFFFGETCQWWTLNRLYSLQTPSISAFFFFFCFHTCTNIWYKTRTMLCVICCIFCNRPSLPPRAGTQSCQWHVICYRLLMRRCHSNSERLLLRVKLSSRVASVLKNAYRCGWMGRTWYTT